MPLTYTESATLMMDAEFRGRIKVASLKYAGYIMDEPTDTTAHSSRQRWAVNTYQQPDTVAMQLQSPVVMDTSVQDAGSAITDSALQSAVEKVVNSLM